MVPVEVLLKVMGLRLEAVSLRLELMRLRLEVMLEHCRRFEEKFAGLKRFEVLRRHFKWYVQGFDSAKSLRMALMETKNADDVAAVIGEYTGGEPLTTSGKSADRP